MLAIGSRTGCGCITECMALQTDKAPVLCLPGLTRNWRDYAALATHLTHRTTGLLRWIFADVAAVNMPRIRQLHAADLCRRRRAAAGRTEHREIRRDRDFAGRDRLADPWRREARAAGGTGAQRCRAGDRRGRARADQILCRQEPVLADLGACRAGHRRDQCGGPSGLSSSRTGSRWPSGSCRLKSSGRIVFDYDMAIAEPLKAPGGGGWGRSMAVVRGGARRADVIPSRRIVGHSVVGDAGRNGRAGRWRGGDCARGRPRADAR